MATNESLPECRRSTKRNEQSLPCSIQASPQKWVMKFHTASFEGGFLARLRGAIGAERDHQRDIKFGEVALDVGAFLLQRSDAAPDEACGFGRREAYGNVAIAPARDPFKDVLVGAANQDRRSRLLRRLGITYQALELDVAAGERS